MLCDFFWVILRCLNFICRRFGTLFHLHMQVGTYPPMKIEQRVPKRRHIKFRRRGITQKKAHKIQVIFKISVRIQQRTNTVSVVKVKVLNFFYALFANLGKATISFVMSVRPFGTTRLPRDGFS